MQNFSTKNPCPICGKPDWCGYGTKGEKEYVFCHRTSPEVGTIINGYYCFKIAEQCGCFETVEQHDKYSYSNKKRVCPICHGEDTCKFWYKERVNFAKCSRFSKKAKLGDIVNGYSCYKINVFGTYFRKENTITTAPVEKIPKIIATNEKRDKAYRELISYLQLEDEDRNYLYSEGWNDAMIGKYHIVSLPPKDVLRYNGVTSINPFRRDLCDRLRMRGIELNNVPGFGKNNDGKWTIAGPGGIVFPVFDFRGRITHLRIRAKHYESDLEYYKKAGKKPPKYCYFSSSNYEGGASNETGYSVYIPDNRDSSVAFITEGEKKGTIICEKRGKVAISLLGVSTFGVLLEKDDYGLRPCDYLKELGVKIVVVCFDADKKYNEHVLKSETKAVEMFKNEGFQVAVGNWNVNIAKGIDDLINKGLNPAISIVK